MMCIVCGAKTRVVTTKICRSLGIRGLEYRTYKCVTCGDTDTRLVLDSPLVGEPINKPGFPQK